MVSLGCVRKGRSGDPAGLCGRMCADRSVRAGVIRGGPADRRRPRSGRKGPKAGLASPGPAVAGMQGQARAGQVWRDGRSTGDRECPKGFADAMKARGEHLVALLNESGIPEQVKNEIRFLMACMHKDAPENCVQWITGQVEGQKIRDLRAVGFALGDVSQQWQKDLLLNILKSKKRFSSSLC